MAALQGVDHALEAESSAERDPECAVVEPSIACAPSADVCGTAQVQIVPAVAELANNDFCEVCQRPGRLLLCDKCPRAFHGPCIERFVDLESLTSVGEWTCPVCAGINVFQTTARESLPLREMQARMADATKCCSSQSRGAARRRDCFLSSRVAQIADFAQKSALARIMRSTAGVLEIGTRVRVRTRVRMQLLKESCALAIVLDHLACDQYRVFDVATRERLVVEREDLVPIPCSEQPGVNTDLVACAPGPLVADGIVLKDYQKVGINWLLHAFFNRCGGILADEMGLGKTLQALACISFLRASGAVGGGPFLVICPLSCAGNWVREAKRFVPHLSVVKICGQSKEREFSLEDDEICYGLRDIVITTYETLTKMTYFQDHFWAAVILDEAHRIKSEASQAREALDSVTCAGRLLLTGTPLQNNLGELFALLRFLWPDILARESDSFTSAVQFETLDPKTGRHRDIEAAGEASVRSGALIHEKALSQVKSLLGTLMLRRKKEDVITLPPKVIRDVWVPASPLQCEWYRAITQFRVIMQQHHGWSSSQMLRLVSRLRQLVGHPRCLSDIVEHLGMAALPEPQLNAVQALISQTAARMDEAQVWQSGKLGFLDKLLSQLHAQNMGLCAAWRRAFEERQRQNSEKGNKRGRPQSSDSWLRSAEDGLLLEEMQAWRPDTQVPKPDAGPPACVDVPRPHKVLIFTQFRSCLDTLEALCALRGWRYLRLDGSTSRVVRELDMRDFNCEDEDCFVYLLATRSGGLGINLATANHVVLFDQDWNPHVDHQAVDRAHRIGQARRVMVYRLMQEWSVEERLAHRQSQKLQMEQCVTQSADDLFDASTAPKERLSADEILDLIRFGESAMRSFSGESLQAYSLKGILARERRPLPAEPLLPDDGVAMDCTMHVVDADDEGDNSAQPLQGHEDVSSALRAHEPPPPPPEIPEGAQRTSRGRIIRAPKPFIQETFHAARGGNQKQVFTHFRSCFACGHQHVQRGQTRPDGQGFDNQELPDTSCNGCPKAYHSACLLDRDVRRLSKGANLWRCGWHFCAGCDRSNVACGGMLIHCLGCPTALCYDCFPPNFRRVYPPQKFYSDLRDRGWTSVTDKTMMIFRCNVCRAFEEQSRRKRMRGEDLAAEQDKMKKAALEEKRSLQSRKRVREQEEAQRRMEQLVFLQKQNRLQDQLRHALDTLSQEGRRLWPQAFRSVWLSSHGKSSTHDSADGPEGKKPKQWSNAKSGVGSAFAESAALPSCASCGLPGHKRKECPLPPEAKRVKEKSYYKKCCTICGQGHKRACCPSLTLEQRAEYEERVAAIGRLTDTLKSAIPLEEPEGVTCESNDATLAIACRQIEQRLTDLASKALRQCGLEWCIAVPPEPIVPPPKREAGTNRTEQTITSGAAAGWLARATLYRKQLVFELKRPEGGPWMTLSEAKKQMPDASAELWREFEDLRQEQARRVKSQQSSHGSQAQQQISHQQPTIGVKGHTRLQETSQGRCAKGKQLNLREQSAIRSTKGVSNECVQSISKGPAAGWVVRGVRFPHQVKISYRLPYGTKWFLAAAAKNMASREQWNAIARTRRSIMAQFGPGGQITAKTAVGSSTSKMQGPAAKKPLERCAVKRTRGLKPITRVIADGAAKGCALHLSWRSNGEVMWLLRLPGAKEWHSDTGAIEAGLTLSLAAITELESAKAQLLAQSVMGGPLSGTASGQKRCSTAQEPPSKKPRPPATPCARPRSRSPNAEPPSRPQGMPVCPFRTGRPSKAVAPKMGEQTEWQQKELAAKEAGAAIPTHPHAAAGDASPRMSSTSKKLFFDLVDSSPVSVHRHEDLLNIVSDTE